MRSIARSRISTLTVLGFVWGLCVTGAVSDGAAASGRRHGGKQGASGPAAEEPTGFPVPGLDSLASATLERALEVMEVRPAELGFDKLYADDDTFRLGIVKRILNDPLRLPGWQTETIARVRTALGNPAALAELLGEIGEAPGGVGAADRNAAGVTGSSAATSLSDPGSTPGQAGSSAARAPFASLLLGLRNGAAPGADPAATAAVRAATASTWPTAPVRISAGSASPAVDAFIASCVTAEASLDEAFAGLRGEDRRRILTLAPAFWGDSEDPADKVRKGLLQAEAGVSADTTLKLSEDPILDAAVRLNRPALTRASREFYTAVTDLAAAVGRCESANGPGCAGNGINFPGVTGDLIGVYKTPWGGLVIGGTGDNTYSAEALREIAFVIEPGGNDVYRGRAASAVGGLFRSFSAIVDEAGDDLYTSEGRTYAIGGAVLGLAALVDLGGNDVYRGDDGCVGAGFFGAGLLYDGGGVDLFEGRNLCEGAGAFGIGALVSQADVVAPPGPEPEEDRGYTLGMVPVPGTGALPVRYDDNDTYLAARQSQGFASTYGVGLLYDRTGNDIYRSSGRYLHRPLLPNDFQSLSQGFSIGFRPRAGGGVGMLIDEEGNDFYDAEVYAQGASYWYSLGLLYDGGGNDRYLAAQYAEGAGIHLSIGSLWDRGGDDHYMCKLGVTQGTAHDLSVGMLLDDSGNDYYAVSDGQGMSITNSTALFIDGQGDDVYATPGVGQGTLTWARGFCGAGIFLDLEGNDTYPEKSPGRNGGIWNPMAYAVGIDLPRNITLPAEFVPPIELTAADSARRVEELFDTASLWEVGSAREKVQRARKALLTKPHEAMVHAVSKKLDSQDGLVYRTLLEIGQAQPDSFAARILPRLRDPDQYTQRNVIALLGEMKRKDARVPIERMLGDRSQEKHWNRLIAALGNIGDPAARPTVRPFLRADLERRRIASTVALAALKDTASIPEFIRLLDDPALTVRSAAATALSGFGFVAAQPLVETLNGSGPAHRALAVRTLGQIACAIPDSARAGALAARMQARRVLMAELERPVDGSARFAAAPGSKPAGQPRVVETPEAAATPAVRAEAVDALLRLGDPQTVDFVRLQMRDESDPLVLRAFRNALPKPEEPGAGR